MDVGGGRGLTHKKQCVYRLLLTAHNADFTESYFRDGWAVWQANLARYRAGEPLETPVDVAAGY